MAKSEKIGTNYALDNREKYLAEARDMRGYRKQIESEYGNALRTAEGRYVDSLKKTEQMVKELEDYQKKLESQKVSDKEGKGVKEAVEKAKGRYEAQIAKIKEKNSKSLDELRIAKKVAKGVYETQRNTYNSRLKKINDRYANEQFAHQFPTTEYGKKGEKLKVLKKGSRYEQLKETSREGYEHLRESLEKSAPVVEKYGRKAIKTGLRVAKRTAQISWQLAKILVEEIKNEFGSKAEGLKELPKNIFEATKEEIKSRSKTPKK